MYVNIYFIFNNLIVSSNLFGFPCSTNAAQEKALSGLAGVRWAADKWGKKQLMLRRVHVSWFVLYPWREPLQNISYHINYALSDIF